MMACAGWCACDQRCHSAKTIAQELTCGSGSHDRHVPGKPAGWQDLPGPKPAAGQRILQPIRPDQGTGPCACATGHYMQATSLVRHCCLERCPTLHTDVVMIAGHYMQAWSGIATFISAAMHYIPMSDVCLLCAVDLYEWWGGLGGVDSAGACDIPRVLDLPPFGQLQAAPARALLLALRCRWAAVGGTMEASPQSGSVSHPCIPALLTTLL